MMWLAGPTALAAVGLNLPALLLLAALGIIRISVSLGPAETVYVIVFVIVGLWAG